mgnify:CR=1 FL=1
MKKLTLGAVAMVAWAMSAVAHAEDLTANIAIKDHRFYPSVIKVPAGQKIKLVFTNMDATPEEPESQSLGFEKVIPGGGRATVFVKPLKAGSYSFFGEFNQATAQGVLVVQ